MLALTQREQSASLWVIKKRANQEKNSLQESHKESKQRKTRAPFQLESEAKLRILKLSEAIKSPLAHLRRLIALVTPLNMQRERSELSVHEGDSARLSNTERKKLQQIQSSLTCNLSSQQMPTVNRYSVATLSLWKKKTMIQKQAACLPVSSRTDLSL